MVNYGLKRLDPGCSPQNWEGRTDENDDLSSLPWLTMLRGKDAPTPILEARGVMIYRCWGWAAQADQHMTVPKLLLWKTENHVELQMASCRHFW